MLSLFDGTSNDKKCYCITCNNLRDLNEYLLNRPGRFHYHFRFDYPDNNEIEIYLKDKLQECYYDEIKNVIRFSNTTNLNYDCLRAIAFELNNGYSFKEAIDDLNIINYNYHETNFTVTVAFNDGTNIIRKHCPINLDIDLNTIWFKYKNRDIFNVSFDIESLKYDYEQNMYYIDDPHKLNYFVDEEDCDSKETYEEFINKKPISITFKNETNYINNKFKFRMMR